MDARTNARSHGLALLLALVMLATLVPIAACAADPSEPAQTSQPAETAQDVHTLVLSSVQTADGWSHSAVMDGAAVSEFDYVWHCDPSEAHDDVKNAPAEYYTGTTPAGGSYIAHDIAYYPALPTDSFVKKSYDGEQEWCCYYTDGVHNDFIFATLPVQGNTVPTQMMHTPEEAYENAVLHLTQPGVYRLEGSWRGQILIDLGEDAFTDPTARVTLILNGVDVTCTVAPALIFRNVYECDNDWEAQESWSAAVDTADAGANVIIADDTENHMTGTNVYRMLKTTYKKDQEGKAVPVQKKQRKTDAAFYSYMSMNLSGQEKGNGVLNVTSGFEGLDSELHLTFNGGVVNIFAQDDGVNVNEDGVSVVTFNGGSVHILAGLGSEGDGVDSNGFLVINGGTVISMANPRSDSGLDSDCGSYVNGGTVVALGSTMDWAEAGEDTPEQVTMNLQFSAAQSSDEAIIVTRQDGQVVFAYDPDKDEVAGAYVRSYQGAVLSFPALTQGETYHVYVGGDVTGTDTAGVYDVSTVTGFTDDAKLQSYAGTWENTGRPGGMGGRGDFDPNDLPQDFDPSQFRGQRPEGQQPDDGQQPPELPEGQQPADGQQPPELPEGQQPADGQQPPELPEGQQPADGQQPPELPEGSTDRFQRPEGDHKFGGAGGFGDRFGNTDSTQQARSTDFTMTAPVNNFSQVADYDAATATLSRAQMVETVWQLCGKPAAGGALPFTDVKTGDAAAQAISWAAAQGLVNGYGDGTFGPNDTVTREMLATVLCRAVTQLKLTLPAGSAVTYSDADAASLWARESVQWLAGTGLLPSGTFEPKAAVTHGAIDALLTRFPAVSA